MTTSLRDDAFLSVDFALFFSTFVAVCQPITYYVLNISVKGVDIVELHGASQVSVRQKLAISP